MRQNERSEAATASEHALGAERDATDEAVLEFDWT
jgi:hypothetical protein